MSRVINFVLSGTATTTRITSRVNSVLATLLVCTIVPYGVDMHSCELERQDWPTTENHGCTLPFFVQTIVFFTVYKR